jgi:hypothetical protein
VIKKVIVLELKDDYALAMEEGGGIIRIQRKNGVFVGDKIYVLPEDVMQDKPMAAVVPFPSHESQEREGLSASRKRPAKTRTRLLGVVAMLAIVITMLLPQMSFNAYAMASFDGPSCIQIELDRYGRILRADSPDGSVSAEALSVLKGKNIKDAKIEISNLCGSEDVLIGYALLDHRVDDKNDKVAQTIQALFSRAPAVYLQGKTDDIHAAKNQSVSLGKYLLEQMDDDELEDILADLPIAEIEQLVQEKAEWMDEDLHEKIEEYKESLTDEKNNDEDDNDIEDNEQSETPEQSDDSDEQEDAAIPANKQPERAESSTEYEDNEDPSEDPEADSEENNSDEEDSDS